MLPLLQLVAKEFPQPDAIDKVIETANSFWQEHPSAHIAIHCAYGFNRTGALLQPASALTAVSVLLQLRSAACLAGFVSCRYLLQSPSVVQTFLHCAKTARA